MEETLKGLGRSPLQHTPVLFMMLHRGFVKIEALTTVFRATVKFRLLTNYLASRLQSYCESVFYFLAFDKVSSASSFGVPSDELTATEERFSGRVQ